MLGNNRLVFLWCALIGGIIFVAILPVNSLTYRFISNVDSNRWCHFLAYATVAAIPFVVWKRKWAFWFFLIPPTIGIVLESLHSYIPGALVRVQNVPADLFGVAAGILLGLNLCAMRNTARPIENVNTSRSDRGTS